MSGRPKRERVPPKPIYVPDENIQFDDDLSVDSEFDEDELDAVIDEIEAQENRFEEDNEYKMDGFVVPDDVSDTEEFLPDEHDDDMSLDDDVSDTSEDSFSEEEDLPEDEYDSEDEDLDRVDIREHS